MVPSLPICGWCRRDVVSGAGEKREIVPLPCLVTAAAGLVVGLGCVGVGVLRGRRGCGLAGDFLHGVVVFAGGEVSLFVEPVGFGGGAVAPCGPCLGVGLRRPRGRRGSRGRGCPSTGSTCPLRTAGRGSSCRVGGAVGGRCHTHRRRCRVGVGRGGCGAPRDGQQVPARVSVWSSVSAMMSPQQGPSWWSGWAVRHHRLRSCFLRFGVDVRQPVGVCKGASDTP